MESRLLCSLIVASAIVGCSTPDELPLPGPPIAMEYEAACDSTNHQKLIILEGYLDLFPRLLSCYPDKAARTGRSCQIELLPRVSAHSESSEEEPNYYTMFIDEGDRPGEAQSRGYGFGPPLNVFSVDSTVIDPYDRVRLIGRFHAGGQAIGGGDLVCSLDVYQIEVAEAAEFSWRDERSAEGEALRARIDSSRAAYDSVRAAHGHTAPQTTETIDG